MRKDAAFGTKEPVQSVRASFELVGYDGIGVTLRMLVEGDSLDFHRSLDDLVRADYLEEPANPSLMAQGKYLITFEGTAAADNA